MKMRLFPHTHKLPPGPSRWPYVNPKTLRALHDNPLGRLMELYDEYGPVFTIKGPGLEMVLLIGPEANQYVTVSNYRDFTWREGFFGELIPFVGDGLLTTDHAVHDRARKLLLPIFQRKRIRGYADAMVERARAMAAKLHPGERVELHEWTRNVALQIAGDLLFGMETDEELAAYFAHHFEEGLSFYGGDFLQTLVVRGPGTPFERMQKHVAKLHRTIDREIRRRRRGPAGGDNILDLLIHTRIDGDRLRDAEIRDHVMTLLFAGHDTTAATVSWMFTQLGRNFESYRRLQAEVADTLGDRPATAADLLDGMPYLDCVVKETLRRYPAAWFGPRRAQKTFHLYGHRIPGGANVAYSSWLTHHLPHLWPDPDAFVPERFWGIKETDLVPGSYVPFGRGPRLCIGFQFGELEVKALVASLLQHVHLELQPGQDFAARTVPTISPRNGVRVTVRDRHHLGHVPLAPMREGAAAKAAVGGCPVGG